MSLPLSQVETFWSQVCFDPDFKPEGRFQTYRELVFEGMLDVLQNICPVARGILSEEEWKQIFWDFLRKAPPQSVVLRRLPFEASQYLKANTHPLSKRYPWLGELMEYEYLEVGLRFAEEDQGSTPDGKIRLNPAHALGIYTWPVHFISEKNYDPNQLPRGEYSLLLWRHPESLEIKFMEINPLVRVLVQILESGPQKPDGLLRSVAQQMELEANSEYLTEGKELLENFSKKGILV